MLAVGGEKGALEPASLLACGKGSASVVKPVQRLIMSNLLTSFASFFFF